MKSHIKLLILLLLMLQLSCKKYDGLSPTSPDLIDIDKSMLAFPTAEGHGAYSKGGRGGRVIYVTNLNDHGDGSFRNAVQQSGARTVVFAVSGIIELKSLVAIENPFLTIAGQTAPLNGITLKNSGLYIKTHDVIIRHIRIRPGDENEGHNFDDRDALTIGENSYNIIADHISASWAIDEIFSTWFEPQYITFQWCILSEALSKSKHPKGEHSKALLVGDGTQKVSVIHNVFAHNNDRAPAHVKGGTSTDIINNINYNWGEFAFSFSINNVMKGVNVNLMSNYFKIGNSTVSDFFSESDVYLNSKIYIDGNIGDDPLLEEYNRNPKLFIDALDYLVGSPVDWEENVKINDIESHYNTLLTNAGATKPKRDIIDTRIVEDVKNRTGTIINSQEDVGGYPPWQQIILTAEELNKIDFDRDGMHDSWELTNGLDPSNPEDGKFDKDNDGYTNLEEFLNEI